MTHDTIILDTNMISKMPEETTTAVAEEGPPCSSQDEQSSTTEQAANGAPPSGSQEEQSQTEPDTEAMPAQIAQDSSSSYGSSVFGAIFNFTNCIVGAGAIGLGGAFADSGGLISVATIVFFALLTKLSLDLVVVMSVENSQPQSSDNNNGRTRSASYEELGFLAYGQLGRMAVLVSKFLYSFGCLVAYIIVVKDNFTPALQHFIYGTQYGGGSWFNAFLLKDGSEDTVTWLLGSFVILPLCLLRDMTPLSSLGAVSIASMITIVVIVSYLFVMEPEVRHEGGSVYQNWFEIRPGYVESWGTFVFTFVSQHTVNLAFESLKPEVRTAENWKRVSSWSLFVATSISLTVGVVVYMTFWDSTQSDLFDMYPPSRIVDVAKMLLCVTMLLTFPLPFFSCRELIIVSIIMPLVTRCSNDRLQETEDSSDLAEPLLPADNQATETTGDDIDANADSTSVIFEDPRDRGICQSILACFKTEDFSIMVPGEEKQLSLPLHLALSSVFWGLSTYLAIVSPNLGDILDLVGSASGTSMAFILPGLLSFKLQGRTKLAFFILVVGGAVGSVGTVCSLKKLVADIS